MKYLHKKRRHKTMTTSLSATTILRIYEGSLKGLPVARKSKVAEFARLRIQYDRGGGEKLRDRDDSTNSCRRFQFKSVERVGIDESHDFAVIHERINIDAAV